MKTYIYLVNFGSYSSQVDIKAPNKIIADAQMKNLYQNYSYMFVGEA